MIICRTRVRNIFWKRSKYITLKVKGENKLNKIKEILGKEKTEAIFPASRVRSKNGKTVCL